LDFRLFQISNFRSSAKSRDNDRQGCRRTAGTDACAPTHSKRAASVHDCWPNGSKVVYWRVQSSSFSLSCQRSSL